MKAWFYLIVVALLFSFLSGCSRNDDKIASGTGSEAGEAYGVAIAANDEVVALKSILVYKIDEGKKELILIDSVMTDEAGAFRFEADAGLYYLEIPGEDGSKSIWSAVVSIPKDEKTDLGDVNDGAKLVSDSLFTDISGTLKSFQMDLNQSLYLTGSKTYSCEFDIASNELHYDSISYACNNVFIEPIDMYLGEKYLFDATSSDLASDIWDGRWVYPNKLILEDWKQADRTHLLEKFNPGSFWHVKADSTSSMTPSLVDVFVDFIKYDSIAQLSYLKVNYDLDTSLANPWVQLNISLGSKGANLSSLDSICYISRGNGRTKLSVFPDTSVINTLPEKDIDIIYVDNTSEWSRVCVNLDTIDHQLDQEDWDIAKISVKSIKFTQGLGDKFDLSTIELWGLKLEDWVE